MIKVEKLNDYYLKDAIKGRNKEDGENRLSQIFCASFNQSKIFKKYFLSFIGRIVLKNENIDNWKADTEKHTSTKNESGRLDIVIADKKKEHVIIENKIEGILTRKQLDLYDKSSKVKNNDEIKKVALVKYCDNTTDGIPWVVKPWSAFYLFLSLNYNKKFNETKLHAETDKFIIENFLKHLTFLNMDYIAEITKTELQSLSKLIYHIRNNRPYAVHLINNNFFEIGTKLLKFLNQIIEKSKEDDYIKKYAEKYGKSHLEYVKDKKELNLWIYNYIAVKKPYNEILYLSTGVKYNNKNNKYSLYYDIEDANYDIIDNGIIYRDNGKLQFDKYSNEVIKFWKSKLKLI